jgi:hypothetical protein
MFSAADLCLLRFRDIFFPSWVADLIDVIAAVATYLIDYLGEMILAARLWSASGSIVGHGIIMQTARSYFLGLRLCLPYVPEQNRTVSLNLYAFNPTGIFYSPAFMRERLAILEQQSSLNMVSHQTDPSLSLRIRMVLGETLYQSAPGLLSSRIIIAGTGSNANLLAVQIALQSQHHDSAGLVKVAMSSSSHVELRRQLKAFLGNERVVLVDDVADFKQHLQNDPAIRVVVLAASTTSRNCVEYSEELFDSLNQKNIWLHLDAALGIAESILPGNRARMILRMVSSPAVSSVTANLHKLFDLEPAACIILPNQDDIDALDAAYSPGSMYHGSGTYFSSALSTLGTTSPNPASVLRALHKYDELGIHGLRFLHLCAHMYARLLARELRASGISDIPEPQLSAVQIDLDSEQEANEIRCFLESSSCISPGGIQLALIPAEGKNPPGVRAVIPLGVFFEIDTIKRIAACLSRVIRNRDCASEECGAEKKESVRAEVFFFNCRTMQAAVDAYRFSGTPESFFQAIRAEKWRPPPGNLRRRIAFLSGILIRGHPK